ncbi:CDGSH iron-sulfur domain-containing protein 3, mitochondrial-like [Clytia hemisphaerica]|uniref:CDGSH iron-sulfur domain-containing protein 3, mitochondrial-like n=1 Tax=Clytia hemisphaerica TaxID=252671 RepID=UPI0034D6911E
MNDTSSKKYPAVPMYGPINIKDELKPGQIKLWCACGLSKKQPWCDGSHKGTGISPLKWTVPENKVQRLFQICNCKYTKAPPFCDATHVYLPLAVKKKQEECSADHSKQVKLCTGCGKVPDW